MEPVPAARPTQPPVARVIRAASEPSRLVAKRIVAAPESVSERLAEHETELNELDSVAGRSRSVTTIPKSKQHKLFALYIGLPRRQVHSSAG